jgi:predicted subunit of tRNA(5-methylaminomethyl-2-thiouridylate) methyltransferase
MEAFADSVGLRALGLGARVIDVLDREIELVLVSFGIAAEFAAAVGEHAQQLGIPSGRQPRTISSVWRPS